MLVASPQHQRNLPKSQKEKEKETEKPPKLLNDLLPPLHEKTTERLEAKEQMLKAKILPKSHKRIRARKA